MVSVLEQEFCLFLLAHRTQARTALTHIIISGELCKTISSTDNNIRVPRWTRVYGIRMQACGHRFEAKGHS